MTYDAGCIDLASAQAVNEAIDHGLGPLIAFDAPLVIDLPHGQLWLVQDAYLNFDDQPPEQLTAGQYANNLLVVFDRAGCGTVLTRPANPNERVSFEYGIGEVTWGKYFWPLGGEAHGDEIVVFWSLMVVSPEQPTEFDGIIRHSEATYVARYDASSFERLSFEPSVNPGVDPQWGFEVLTVADWTYLYGNDNVLNLARVGGLGAGPHPSTEMFISRVATGRFDSMPAYWDGIEWTANPAEAKSISTRGYVANQIHPRRVDDFLVSVTTLDEFWGEELIVDVARSPQGPWMEAMRIDLDRDGPHDLVSYHPVLLPPSQDETLTALVSFNAADWNIALANPHLYRPIAFDIHLDVLRDALDSAG